MLSIFEISQSDFNKFVKHDIPEIHFSKFRKTPFSQIFILHFLLFFQILFLRFCVLRNLRKWKLWFLENPEIQKVKFANLAKKWKSILRFLQISQFYFSTFALLHFSQNRFCKFGKSWFHENPKWNFSYQVYIKKKIDLIWISFLAKFLCKNLQRETFTKQKCLLTKNFPECWYWNLDQHTFACCCKLYLNKKQKG